MPRTLIVSILALMLALLAAPVAALAPLPTLVGLGVALLFGVVVFHPAAATYLLLAATPLLVGMDRGRVLPLLRPNEALALLLGGALAARGAFNAVMGYPRALHWSRVESALTLLAVTGSVMPLLWMVARGRQMTADDLLYGLTIWKYAGTYLIVRVSVRTERQAKTCLVVSMSAACLVAVVAILQSLQLFGLPALLATWYSPFDDAGALAINRGTATLSNAQATADVLAFNLAVACAWLAHGGRRGLLLTTSLLFMVGVVAAGTFSGLFALLVAVASVGLLTGRITRSLGAVLPALTVAGLALQPVIERRLSAFAPNEDVPSSWVGRLQNLRTYFWPELRRNANYLLGVRPSARIPAPEPWRPYIFIESGYTWLLWTGGIPLLAAFVYWVWTVLRATIPRARSRTDAIGIAATASVAATLATVVLMLVDPHLTLRGSADLSFALLALALTEGGSDHMALPQTGDIGTEGGSPSP